MSKFIKVDSYIINIDTIDRVYLGVLEKEATVYLTDGTQLHTYNVKPLLNLVEKEEPTYINEELGITTDTTIEDFATVLPHRYMEKVKNCLKRNNINTIGDLINSSQREIKNMRGLGRGSFEMIMRAANDNGIYIPR